MLLHMTQLVDNNIIHNTIRCDDDFVRRQLTCPVGDNYLGSQGEPAFSFHLF